MILKYVGLPFPLKGEIPDDLDIPKANDAYYITLEMREMNAIMDIDSGSASLSCGNGELLLDDERILFRGRLRSSGTPSTLIVVNDQEFRNNVEICRNFANRFINYPEECLSTDMMLILLGAFKNGIPEVFSISLNGVGFWLVPEDECDEAGISIEMGNYEFFLPDKEIPAFLDSLNKPFATQSVACELD